MFKGPVYVSGKVSGKNFDRNVTVESPVARAIDLTHAAFANLGDDDVLSDRSVGGKSHSNA